MTKRLRLLPAIVALALAAWFMPGSATPAQAASAMQTAQQQPNGPGAEPAPQRQQRQLEHQEDMQQESPETQQSQTGQNAAKTQLILNGKIYSARGHYMFRSNDTGTAFRVSNPAKVRRYKGENVRIEARVNQKSHSIHVSKVERTNS